MIPPQKPVVALTKELRDQFRQLRSLGQHDAFALMSCTINGEVGGVICRMEPIGREYILTPLWVSVTPGMEILDKHGADVKEPGQ